MGKTSATIAMCTVITHDSASVRRAHNAGRNHLTNVREYYSSLGHDKAQDLIDQITKMYESGGPPPNRPFPSAPMSMGAGPLNPMGGMPMRPPFGGPPGMMGGPPQQFNPQQQFQQPPQFQQQPPPFGQNPPMHFGQGQGSPSMGPPPMFFGGGGPPPMAPPPGFRPPPGMAPPPGFFGAGGPGATISSGPSMSAPLPSGAPVSASGDGPKQSGMNPERARMLGLL